MLDECVDRRLSRELPGLDVKTVAQMGWAGIRNGSLMSRASVDFDVFITEDRNLSYQQNLTQYDIALIVIRSVSNRYQDLIPFAPLIVQSLDLLEIGKATVLSL